jgi:hypothetical protein
MVNMLSVQTDAAATSGTGADLLSGLTFFKFGHGIMIVDIYQTAGAVLANDADWTLYVNGKQTDWSWTAEELDPASSGRPVLRDMPTKGISIAPGRTIQLLWSGQGAAQANILRVLYEII